MRFLSSLHIVCTLLMIFDRFVIWGRASASEALVFTTRAAEGFSAGAVGLLASSITTVMACLSLPVLILILFGKSRLYDLLLLALTVEFAAACLSVGLHWIGFTDWTLSVVFFLEICVIVYMPPFIAVLLKQRRSTK